MVEFRLRQNLGHHRNIPAGIFITSCGIATLGLWVEYVPLWVNIVPFAFAIFCRNWILRVIIGLAWCVPIALPTVWGLWSIGHPIIAILLGFGGAVVFSVVGARIGFAFLSLILSASPHWIASPASMLADLVPGAGWNGLMTLALAWGAMEIVSWRRADFWVSGVLFSVLILGLLSFHFTQASKPTPTPWKKVFHEHDIQGIAALTPRGEWSQIKAGLSPDASGVILGESASSEGAASLLSDWCTWSGETGKAVYAGILTDDGGSEARLIDAGSCPDGVVLYTPQVSIPGITGGWAVSSVPLAHVPTAFLADWMICFEAFSLRRWLTIEAGLSAPIIVLSNDSWTTPLPVPIIRRKVAGAMANLLMRDIYFADRGRSILEVPNAI